MKIVCSGIDGNINYKKLYESVKLYGCVSRIKLILKDDKQSFDVYIVFDEALSAKITLEAVNNHQVPILKGKAKLFDIRTLVPDSSDFVPKDKEHEDQKNIVRRMEIPTWHVVSFKEGQTNMIRAWENLE